MVRIATVLGEFLSGRNAEMLTLAPGATTPRYFSGARREHLATRAAAGLFDFSFMGCVEIAGAASLPFLNSLQSRALDGLRPGRIAYTLLLRDDGTVLNDATVWRLADNRYRLFSGRHSDIGLIADYATGFEVEVRDVSRHYAVIALQGPASRSIIERCFAGKLRAAIPYYGFETLDFAGSNCNCELARIGYSGESGYELMIADAAAPALWKALLAAGVNSGLLECGFDAVDSLRIEAGHILFARELAQPVTPLELGLARFVDFYRAPFRGARALQAQRWRAPRRRLVGLLPAADAAPDQDLVQCIAPGSAVMTSACWSPLYACCLGIGFVAPEDVYPGTRLSLSSGIRAQVARLPFYDPGRSLPRRMS